MNATTCKPMSSELNWRFHSGRLREPVKPERSDAKESGNRQTSGDEAKRFRLPFRDRGIQPQLATAARNGANDGSPWTRFDLDHIHRRQRSGFFCLPRSNLRAWGRGRCACDHCDSVAGPLGANAREAVKQAPTSEKIVRAFTRVVGVGGVLASDGRGGRWVPSRTSGRFAVDKGPGLERDSPARTTRRGWGRSGWMRCSAAGSRTSFKRGGRGPDLAS